MANDDTRRVIALMERHGIAAFDYEQGALRLYLTRGLTGAISADVEGAEIMDASTSLIRSPGVGRFCHVHPASTGKPALLPRTASKGEIVAYIRTGKTLRAVVADRDCMLQRVTVEDGQGIGYADPLFEITAERP